MPNGDLKIINLCLKGEGQNFEKLLNKYKLPVFNLIYRLVKNAADAEDLAQETFIKAFKNLNKYDSKYPFLTWLFRIAHNLTIDFFRANKKIIVSIDDPDKPLHIEDKSPSVEHITERNFDSDMLYKTLDKINPLYREVLLLRHKEELDYEEIANILDIPLGTVKIRLFRAREVLKQKLAHLNS
jgi:RNA polymerase sigma-70 factor (ECF subfamily)